jgi:hypothetical protein
MPRLNERLRQRLVEYEKEQVERGNGAKHIKDTLRALRRCADILRAQGMDIPPLKMGRTELNTLKAAFPSGPKNPDSCRNAQYHVEAFRTFLVWCKADPPIMSWPIYEPKRPIIEKEEFVAALQSCLNERDWKGAALLVLEGLTGRRIALERLINDWVTEDSVTFRDKGKGKGKMRTLEINGATTEVLMWAKAERKVLITGHQKKWPDALEPDAFFVYARGKRLGGCKRSALDTILKKVEMRVGIHLEHHALRRRGCEDLIETLQAMGLRTDIPAKSILDRTGHEKWEDFLKYIRASKSQSEQLASAQSYIRGTGTKKICIPPRAR